MEPPEHPAGSPTPAPHTPGSAAELTVVVVGESRCRRPPTDAMRSILEQEGVALEVVFVDDASRNGSREAVEELHDPRVRILSNERRRGRATCYNLAAAASEAPFLAHVEADGLVLPGAFRALLEECRAAPRAAQVFPYSFEIDEAGHVTRETYRRHRQELRDRFPPGADLRRELLVGGALPNDCRVYRRDLLQSVREFDEDLGRDAVYEMDLRLAERWEIRVVPQFLACRRVTSVRTGLPAAAAELSEGLLHLARRLRIRRRKCVSFLQEPAHSERSVLVPSLRRTLASETLAEYGERAGAITQRVRALRSRAGWEPLLESLYHHSIARLSSWPLDLVRARKRAPSDAHRIAYFIWQFPVLTQTFVYREVKALHESGLPLVVVVEEPGGVELTESAARFVDDVARFPFPLEKDLLERSKRRFRLRRPFVYLNLLVYVLARRYGVYKDLAEDRTLFAAAVGLAGWLEEAGVRHLHCPWADRTAFVALVASRLLGIPFSVQARAFDLHKGSYPYRAALPEILGNAAFVVTNSRYNEAYVREHLREAKGPAVHTIYEGVDLEQLSLAGVGRAGGDGTRILCVARLIEPKGLIYLLEACALLRRAGWRLSCEVIGGADEPAYTNYRVRVQRTYRRLELDDCVFFRGAQPWEAVVEAYRNADIFVLPCVSAADGHRDVTPNALIEAMAMELPVVSTTSTAIPEIVEHGVSGLLVPPRDVPALAEALAALMGDAGLRKRLGEAARRRVEERFDIHKNVRRYVELFSSSVGEGNGARRDGV